jgi:putative ABC transport system permease protein
MFMEYELICVGLQQGLLLALVAYGVMIPFRLLNFSDLTAEGAYPFAGAICSVMLLNGINPIISLVIAAILSGFIGIGTALLTLKLKVNSLLAGIILSTMLYSINLRIMGKPNLGLFDTGNLFANESILFKISILLIVILIVVLPFYLFLYTEKGLRLRAVGLNVGFANRQTISVAKYTILGLFIANAFSGLAGGLMVQLQNYMDIGMGVGIVIHALAALMIGEAVVGEISLEQKIIAPLVGALIYQQIQGLVISIGFAPSDMKFLTGLIVITVLVIRKKSIN